MKVAVSIISCVVVLVVKVTQVPLNSSYLLEDDLMRIFGADNITGIMDKLGMEGMNLLSISLITKSIERAQKKVEDHNYIIRKYVLEYDDVMNQQREVLYEQRRRILRNESLRETINEMIDKLVTESVDAYADEKLYPEEWDYEGLYKHLSQYFLTEDIMTPSRYGRI